MSTAKTALLTFLALVAFAGNSLLCRMALLPGDGDAAAIDPVGFTVLRILSGALVLCPVLVWAVRREPAGSQRATAKGSLRAAAAMILYAFPFSFSYVTLPAGVGALVLFGVVQIVMLGAALLRGEPFGLWKCVGLVAALGGVWVLVGPAAVAGADQVDTVGAALMIVAGAGWGIYTLLGRGGRVPPTEMTAMNFAVCAPLALAVGALALANGRLASTPRGVLLSLSSGAITSGAGYAIWYAALRGHSRTSAAAVQLCVPLIAAVGGVWLLDETLTLRFAVSCALVLGGIGLTLGPWAASRKDPVK